MQEKSPHTPDQQAVRAQDEDAATHALTEQLLQLDGPGLNHYPAPVAVIAADGHVIAGNIPFFQKDGLCLADRSGLAAPVRACLDAVLGLGRHTRCSVPGPDGMLVFDLSALPLAGMPAHWLLQATEATVEVSMRNALIESRARYMDLVSLSGESAWETAADGCFTFVTPNGIAGFDPRQLIGLHPVRLLDPGRAAPTVLPFTTPQALSHIDLWVRHAEGQSLCFEISAVPLYDEAGVWQGARGICRDVTEDRRNRAYLAELRSNERLLARITEVFRQKSNPDDMLTAAADACLQGLAASGCQVLGVTGGQGEGAHLVPLVSVGSQGEAESTLTASRDDDFDRKVRIVTENGWSVLIAPTIYGGRLIGAIMLWRNPTQAAWNDQEAQLIGTLAGQLAAAIDQRAEYLRLLDASRTDPLTGMYNRRAFDDELQRRLNRLDRDRRRAALLYVDLDNFKTVNDLRGHDVGDEALRHLADILRTNTRSTDLLARLGGDEFAVLLEDVSELDSVKRAKTFLLAGSALAQYSGNAAKPLQMSIGIAPYDPDKRESVTALLKRADAAMYHVKRSGKGNYAMAPPPGDGT
jgi:diguanylate cyclase (GGDEF)-like protein